MYPVQYPWITNYGPRDKKEPNASTENKLLWTKLIGGDLQ
jgi:hypothetical protein